MVHDTFKELLTPFAPKHEPLPALINLDKLADAITALERRAGEYDDYGKGYNAGIAAAYDLVDALIKQAAG